MWVGGVTDRDEIVVSLVHDGAKEIISPHGLRLLKYRAFTLDMSYCKTAFLQELEGRYSGATLTGAATLYFSPPLVTPFTA